MRWSVSAIFIIATLCLAFIPAQSDFFEIAIFYSISFGAYYLLAFKNKLITNGLDFRSLLVVAVLIRFALIFSQPNLSDDVFRFIWDGQLILNGINPYGIIPSDILELELSGQFKELYPSLNSQDYYSIYPPFTQFIFMISAWLGGNSVMISTIIMKLTMFLAEMLSIFIGIKILEQIGLAKDRISLYALNPLIIIEIMGNLHFEGWMIAFLALFIWMLFKQKWLKSGMYLSLSVASKLLPLMFIPFLFRNLQWKAFIKVVATSFALVGLFFFPIWSNFLDVGFLNSVDLYFRKFEFNASIYFLCRFVGQQISRYNMIALIGPLLALISTLFILFIALRSKIDTGQDLIKKMLFAFCIYLIFATTVHPWYLSVPIFLCIFSNYRFPIVWSLLIPLTYINYSYEQYYENLWVVSLEYLLLLIYVIWEFKSIQRIITVSAD